MFRCVFLAIPTVAWCDDSSLPLLEYFSRSGYRLYTYYHETRLCELRFSVYTHPSQIVRAPSSLPLFLTMPECSACICETFSDDMRRSNIPYGVPVLRIFSKGLERLSWLRLTMCLLRRCIN